MTDNLIAHPNSCSRALLHPPLLFIRIGMRNLCNLTCFCHLPLQVSSYPSLNTPHFYCSAWVLLTNLISLHWVSSIYQQSHYVPVYWVSSLWQYSLYLPARYWWGNADSMSSWDYTAFRIRGSSILVQSLYPGWHQPANYYPSYYKNAMINRWDKWEINELITIRSRDCCWLPVRTG